MAGEGVNASSEEEGDCGGGIQRKWWGGQVEGAGWGGVGIDRVGGVRRGS